MSQDLFFLCSNFLHLKKDFARAVIILCSKTLIHCHFLTISDQSTNYSYSWSVAYKVKTQHCRLVALVTWIIGNPCFDSPTVEPTMTPTTMRMAPVMMRGIPTFQLVERFFQHSLILAGLSFVLSAVSMSSLPSPPLRGMLLILFDH